MRAMQSPRQGMVSRPVILSLMHSAWPQLRSLRHSFRVDALMRFVTGSFANILIVAPTPVAWPGKVSKCQSLHHTPPTFEHVGMTLRARKGYLRFSTPKTANTVCLSPRLLLVLTFFALFDMLLIMVSNFSISESGS